VPSGGGIPVLRQIGFRAFWRKSPLQTGERYIPGVGTGAFSAKGMDFFTFSESLKIIGKRLDKN